MEFEPVVPKIQGQGWSYAVRPLTQKYFAETGLLKDAFQFSEHSLTALNDKKYS